MGCGEEDLQRQRVQATGKKTFGGGCSVWARLSGVPAGGGWLLWRVPNGAMGSENKLGTTTEVRDNNGDTTSGIKAEGRVRDRVGDGDDTTSRELVV
jgi:hypothetical protein